MVYRAEMAVETSREVLWKYFDKRASICKDTVNRVTVVASKDVTDERFLDYLGNYQLRCIIV